MDRVEKTNVTHYSHQSKVLNEAECKKVLLHLELSLFKQNLCRNKSSHNHKKCPYYHNSKDKIRGSNFFEDDMCEFIQNNEQCYDGSRCRFAHNRVEQLYKPDKYKTKFCSHYPNRTDQCEYGKYCSFAHSEQDIKI